MEWDAAAGVEDARKWQSPRRDPLLSRTHLPVDVLDEDEDEDNNPILVVVVQQLA